MESTNKEILSFDEYSFYKRKKGSKYVERKLYFYKDGRNILTLDNINEDLENCKCGEREYELIIDFENAHFENEIEIIKTEGGKSRIIIKCNGLYADIA